MSRLRYTTAKSLKREDSSHCAQRPQEHSNATKKDAHQAKIEPLLTTPRPGQTSTHDCRDEQIAVHDSKKSTKSRFKSLRLEGHKKIQMQQKQMLIKHHLYET